MRFRIRASGCSFFTILPFYHFTILLRYGSALRSKIRAIGSPFYHFTILPFDLGGCLRSRIRAPESLFHHSTIWPGGLLWLPESALLGAYFNHFTILQFDLGVCHEIHNQGCWEPILPFYHLTWESALRSRIRGIESSFYHLSFAHLT